ncbi:MAG: riboflavin synthase [Desulfobacteraceae bacterium]|nr:MAG: riboflavin synthase [Desulfobacteraceae bacterium]
MFTGIIEGQGTLTGVRSVAGARAIAVAADYELQGTRIGDSIAVNGACLTVTSLAGSRFTSDVSPETLSKTIFSAARIGDRVNLERAMRLSDRLDGHLVSGHVDGIGYLAQRESVANAMVLTFSVPHELTRCMIVKGSVAVDGVSLTINRLEADSFQVSIIPHTAAITTIGRKEIGAAFNIETDLIGKYIQRFMSGAQDKPGGASRGIDMELLAKAGFLDRP